MKNKIKVLVIDENGNISIEILDNSLECFQQIVDGYVECLELYNQNIVILCDEEGYLKNKNISKYLVLNEHLLGIVGTFILAGLNNNEFCSLTDKQIKYYYTLLK